MAMVPVRECKMPTLISPPSLPLLLPQPERINGEMAWAAARVMPALPAFLRRSRRVILPDVVSDLVFFNEVTSIYVRRNTLGEGGN